MALLNAQDILKEINISRATLYRLLEEGLPYEEAGVRKKMFDPDVVREFMQKRKDDVHDQLIVGKEYTNDQISSIFRVGIMGGMRRSKTKNALVLISVHSGMSVLYRDYWKGDILYYTGMGKIGDQDINATQNKTLAESNNNGIRVYLFEVFKEKKYQYRGIVKLIGEPFREQEMDAEGNMRSVWKFPLQLVTTDYLTEDFVEEKQEEEIKSVAERLSPALLQLAKSINEVVSEVTTISRTYVRNPIIAEFAKKRANGFCELCGQRAPFRVEGEPYLETHHIIPLSEGGMDSMENVAALCPNCHRKVHYLKDPRDVELIRKNVEDDDVDLQKWVAEDVSVKQVMDELPVLPRE